MVGLTGLSKKWVNNWDSVLNILFYHQALIVFRNIIIRAQLLATCQTQQTTVPVCLSSRWNNTSQMWFCSALSERKETEPGSTVTSEDCNNTIHLSVNQTRLLTWCSHDAAMKINRKKVWGTNIYYKPQVGYIVTIFSIIFS